MPTKRNLAKEKSRDTETVTQVANTGENPETGELTRNANEEVTQLPSEADDEVRSESESSLSDNEEIEMTVPGMAQMLRWVQEGIDRRFEKFEREHEAKENFFETKMTSLLEQASLIDRKVGSAYEEAQSDSKRNRLPTKETKAETAPISRGASNAITELLKSVISTLPQYDGQGDMQKLHEFIRKHDDCFTIAELNPSLELITATSKLTGMADLWWQDHITKNGYDSTSRIRTWRELRNALMETFAPPEYEMTILAQLKTLKTEKYVDNRVQRKVYSANDAGTRLASERRNALLSGRLEQGNTQSCRVESG